MAFLLDLIDIKWFIDNYGDVLKGLLDAIIILFKGASAEDEDETSEPTK